MGRLPQPLRIKTNKQLDWLIDHLTTEVHRAHDHWKLWSGLKAAVDEYPDETSQSLRFWDLTLQAHQDSVILRLGRLFDPTQGALSLGNFLCTVKDHMARTPPPPAPNLALLSTPETTEELSSVSETDSAVAKILRIRNEYLAHREARLVGSGTFSGLPELWPTEIQRLLSRALDLVNKYRHLRGRPFLSSQLPGGDDYQNLFELLRSALAHIDENSERAV